MGWEDKITLVGFPFFLGLPVDLCRPGEAIMRLEEAAAEPKTGFRRRQEEPDAIHGEEDEDEDEDEDRGMSSTLPVSDEDERRIRRRGGTNRDIIRLHV